MTVKTRSSNGAKSTCRDDFERVKRVKSDLNDDLRVDNGQLDDSGNDFGGKDVSVANKEVLTDQNSKQLDLDQSTERPTLDKMPILVLALIRKKLMPYTTCGSPRAYRSREIFETCKPLWTAFKLNYNLLKPTGGWGPQVQDK